MKLYAGLARNVFRVTAFMDEKDIKLPMKAIDVMKGEARTDEHRKRNSLAEIPVLELDDGSFLTESIAICRYLESLYPEPPLMGRDPLDIARVEMWNRRMEQQIMKPYAEFGLHTMPIFATKVEQLPEYAETQKRLSIKNWQWLNSEMDDGRKFITGDTFTVADITAMTALMIGDFIDLPIPAELSYMQRWSDSVRNRPSWND